MDKEVENGFRPPVCTALLWPSGLATCLWSEVLRELINVPARLISIIFKSSRQSGKVPNDWKKASGTPGLWNRQVKQSGELQASQPYLSSWESYEANSPAICKHIKDKKATGNSQHKFTKGKSCLTTLTAFCDAKATLVDRGRVVDAVSLDFSKTFYTVSHSILIAKSVKYKLEKSTTRWVENMAGLLSPKSCHQWDKAQLVPSY